MAYLARDLREVIGLVDQLLTAIEDQSLSLDQVDTFDDVTAEVITTCRWLATHLTRAAPR
ncbi:hypothetical protein [Actinokineospora sp. NBRC 105648]|uniref:hypothetical protein n=1 Tax=Actinokineospora sp. NBRC 105648 TaxID=3032206 RepID=UPI0024A1EC86|nr:hypothetical protein [Actinokineospora sp. NBRC 105648]GLZ36465.1 hypothetical protein Acsp05_00900 [Actinokineospora sp. NBRC 105648]